MILSRVFPALCILGAVLLPGGAAAEDAVIAVGETVGAPESSVEVLVSISNETELTGWSFGICHDDAIVEPIDTTLGEAIDEEEYLFLHHEADEDGVRMVAVTDPQDEVTLAVGDDQAVLLVDYDLVGEHGEGSDLTVCDTVGDPPVEIVVTVGSEAGDFVTVDGRIDINGNSFVRGDANGSGFIEALPDAIFMLSYLILGDLDDPPCRDALDVNDDGVVSTIVDALYLLQYAYTGGDDPPDPGPSDCGTDPTGDPIGCDEESCP